MLFVIEPLLLFAIWTLPSRADDILSHFYTPYNNQLSHNSLHGPFGINTTACSGPTDLTDTLIYARDLAQRARDNTNPQLWQR